MIRNQNGFQKLTQFHLTSHIRQPNGVGYIYIFFYNIKNRLEETYLVQS